MAIRDDSYSSVEEVETFNIHLFDGQGGYDSTTRPTLTQVEKFIDRTSAMLNVALARWGLSTPVTNSTAKLACDNWVTLKTAEYCELTAPSTGAFSPTDETRAGVDKSLAGQADLFARNNVRSFRALGVGYTAAHPGVGLKFTGETVYADRADPDDSTLRQPRFRRGMFENDADDTNEETE